MRNLKGLIDLQILAGEGGDGAASVGDSGDAGATVDNSADDGQTRLLELGVPQNKIRNDRAYMPSAPEIPATQSAEDTQQAAAAEEAPKTEAKRLTWDEIMADPEYNKAMQETVQKRLSKSKAAEDKLSKLAPALELIGRTHNIDTSNINNLDVEAFVKAVTEDTAYYEDKAAELGVPVETAMKIEQLERDKRIRDIAEQQSAEERRFQMHFINLQRQADELKTTFPNFNLQAELQNPVFLRMTSPEGGISVADAYYAVHREEIQKASMQVAAQKVSEKMSSAIQSGMKRPVENGAQSQPASVSTFDYRNMSKDQRAALKRQIQQAAARGEKLYPNK